MKRMKSIKRKFFATLLLSIFASIALIVPGLFFDVDINQIQRLTIEGFFLTFFIVFPFLLLLEWIFDLENHEEFRILEGRIRKLERKRK